MAAKDDIDIDEELEADLLSIRQKLAANQAQQAQEAELEETIEQELRQRATSRLTVMKEVKALRRRTGAFFTSTGIEEDPKPESIEGDFADLEIRLPSPPPDPEMAVKHWQSKEKSVKTNNELLYLQAKVEGRARKRFNTARDLKQKMALARQVIEEDEPNDALAVAREEDAAKRLSGLGQELSEKVHIAQEAELAKFLKEKPDQDVDALRQKLIQEENEKKNLISRLAMMEDHLQAELTAKEELEGLKNELRMNAEDRPQQYQVLLADLRLMRGKIKDERGRARSLEGRRKELEEEMEAIDAQLRDEVQTKKKVEEKHVVTVIERDSAMKALKGELSDMEMASAQLEARALELKKQLANSKFTHLLVSGHVWLKHCRRGGPKARFVWVTRDLSRLQWRNPKKKVSVSMSDHQSDRTLKVESLVGMKAQRFKKLFKKKDGTTREQPVFLLKFTSKERDADLVLETDNEGLWREWVEALRFLWARAQAEMQKRAT